MTAKAKIEVYNKYYNLVINEHYKNLFLSRIIAGNTLPLEYMNWNNNCYMIGNFLARRIDFLPERDEVFAVVAAPAGQECEFFIFNSVMGNINKAYLCAAQRVYPSDFGGSTYQWDDPNDTIVTGMTDTRDVPSGIDVFIFAKSDKDTSDPTGKKQTPEKAGIQIFDENENCVYDSRFKSARILGTGEGYPSISSNTRVAIGGTCGVYTVPHYQENYYETIIYGYGTRLKRNERTDEMEYRTFVCMSRSASTATNPYISYYQYYGGWIMFDVTNF